jgi:hypothetical protein
MQLQLCHGIQASFLKHSNIQNTGHIKKKKKKGKLALVKLLWPGISFQQKHRTLSSSPEKERKYACWRRGERDLTSSPCMGWVMFLKQFSLDPND